MVTLSELPESSSSASRRDALIAEGNSRFVDEDWDGAIDSFTRALDVDAAHPSAQALSRRAAVHLKLERYEDAVADAKRAIEADPTLAISHLRRGIACFELLEHEAALQSFKAALDLEPQNPKLKEWIRKVEAEADLEGGSERPVSATNGTAPVPTTDTHPSPPSNIGEPAPPASAPPSQPAPPAPRYRHEWYQSADKVVVTIFAKGVKADQLQVDLGEQVLSVTIDGAAGEEPYVLALRLFGKINPEASKHVLMSTKIELRLSKAEAIQWTGLEAAQRAKAAVLQPINVSTDAGNVKVQYPSSSKHRKNWDQLEQEVKKEEKEEKLDGDAGLNKFFREIYGDADEETRRAMNKSFVESNGTVLSTNWKDVGKGKVEHKE